MLKKKIAFIIGVTGQDGSYLSAFLIKKKYQVFGFTRNLDKKNLVKYILRNKKESSTKDILESNKKNINSPFSILKNLVIN